MTFEMRETYPHLRSNTPVLLQDPPEAYGAGVGIHEDR